MSIELSLYWQSADRLEWYWPGDANIFMGSLEELLDQKQARNLPVCPVRLFLPEYWFSTLELNLPEKTRRLSGQALKFAAEEFLAQDIDSVHLVLKNKPLNGAATVLVTELERFQQVLQTLRVRGLIALEAFNCQDFSIPDNQTHETLLQISEQIVTLSARDQIFKIHPKGFPQWFEMWSQQNQLDPESPILILSANADGVAKSIVSQFEATGIPLQWLVQDVQKLIDWHERAENKKQPGNLITAEFSQQPSNSQYRLWLPALVAGMATFVLWVTLTVLDNQQLTSRIEQTLTASDSVFLQVFGQDKRIQRSLMVREMRTLVAESGNVDGTTEVNALAVLNDLAIASPTFKLEDFRYNRDRKEAYFTLVQEITAEGDAFGLFETLKTGLMGKGYAVEYSANQDKDVFRARFKSVYGGQV
ncbi:type II secretion system protein GspL [Reinekea sp.]|jgi:type II secretory pathway component PulL|uniref:type II secretion system protein GspL n=1 Tax=Reinekea sp. TaxID=1970455 RepID=UPI002A7EE851|nr:type II secretion system protein GspL [Reinekea sp.]